MADQTKEELLGQIQRLNAQVKQKRSAHKGQFEVLKEIDDKLPAKQEVVEIKEKMDAANERLKQQREGSTEWRNQSDNVKESKADLDTILEALSDVLVRYLVLTKHKAVHAVPDDPASVDREIVTVATVGKKVAANLSLFDDEEL